MVFLFVATTFDVGLFTRAETSIFKPDSFTCTFKLVREHHTHFLFTEINRLIETETQVFGHSLMCLVWELIDRLELLGIPQIIAEILAITLKYFPTVR